MMHFIHISLLKTTYGETTELLNVNIQTLYRQQKYNNKYFSQEKQH